MKATKHYENNAVLVYAEDIENNWTTCLTFRNEQQMQQLGECLKDLARTGGTKVSIGENKKNNTP